MSADFDARMRIALDDVAITFQILGSFGLWAVPLPSRDLLWASVGCLVERGICERLLCFIRIGDFTSCCTRKRRNVKVSTQRSSDVLYPVDDFFEKMWCSYS